jgi:hypothetical protein
MRSITLRLLPPVVLALGLLLALIIGLRPVVADEPAPGPERADPRGWSKGVPAAGVQQALAAHAVVPVDLPAALARDITQRTALFYFSPTCPHCTAAMPEINALAKTDTGLKWIGVASGSSTEEQLLAFEATYQPAFELVIDTDRSFAAALGARSTPSLYIARPLRPEEDTSGLPPAQGFGRVGIDEAYAPYGRGAGGVLLLRSDPSNPFKHFDGGYQGETTCGVCHSEERLSMAITHHQAALWTLYRRERHTEEPCVKCHVTGMGAPGGFVMGDLGHPMAGVQCEACHGPGGPHDGQRQDAKTSCVGCHDKEHSVAFSVEKGLPHIDHFKANHMSEAELHAALAAIEEGSAAKPLLAFPEGPTVGAASCKSCHKKQHKWAQRDPHGAAMGRLSAGEDAQRVECVRCHATPKAVGIGAPRSSAADFRVDEGVGCESCHGPGAAHAAAPTKDNIVGLGDSCPECVIEAICTSCHDQTWDPKWELKARMAAIPH